MTSSNQSRIRVLRFDSDTVSGWRDPNGRHHDWPVVYLLNNQREIYIGESTRARVRLQQHLANPEKNHLRELRVVINEEFNKSACLDLESRLIAWLHADSKFKPLNRNDGQQNSNYFERNTRYQPIFDAVFEQLRAAGLFTRSVPEIENLNIFKLSPFKALNDEQLIAVDGILEGLFHDLENEQKSLTVVQGGPGTGKTIVAIYLLKLLLDIQNTTADPDPEEDGRFSDFFTRGYREQLEGLNIGFVIPQQSLRKTVHKVFRQTPGLNRMKVLSPYTVANSDDHWDILVVDEAHRLTHRGSGMTIGQFRERNRKLFGEGGTDKTAIDWIVTKSDHHIFLTDGDQTVRPADVSPKVIQSLKNRAHTEGRLHSLESQMRLAAGDQYLEFARRLLTDDPIPAKVSGSYDLRFFEDIQEMRTEIVRKESDVGLSRLVAGYAWKWNSKGKSGDDAPYDIEIRGTRLRWNRTDIDWIASSRSSEEVGSVHTVQGYDLNYAGVIIGPDIIWDDASNSIKASREDHYDTEVRRVKDEQELLEYIRNSYYVLLTRGMLGTYVYVHDLALREKLRTYFDSRR